MKKIFLVLTAAALILSAGCRSSNTETGTPEDKDEFDLSGGIDCSTLKEIEGKDL